MTPTVNRLSRTFATSICLAALATSAFAEGPRRAPQKIAVAADENGPERIDYSGKLQMLSQRAAAAACNKAAGIGGWEAEGYLQASVGEFDRIMNALEHGDAFISIKAPERDRRVLRSINATNEHWSVVRAEMNKMVAGEATAEQIRAVTGSSPEFLDLIQRMVAEIVGEYADPATLLASDAVTLDMVGRERTMPQVISKWACMLSEGIDEEVAESGLSEAIAHYDLALDALRNGMPEAGVSPPPNQAIGEHLAEIDARWQAVRPMVVDLKAEALSAEDRAKVFQEMNALSFMMNEVSRLYAVASKQS